MKNYLFLGDTHGDLDFAAQAAELAAEHDAEIIQVGDWGFEWPKASQVFALSAMLERAGEKFAKPPVTMRFIDGNHDWHPELRRLVETLNKHVEPFPCGGVQLAPNVIYQPRASTHVDEDGTRFLFVGGAPSIDKHMRKLGKSWWPEEIITEEEHVRALAVEGQVNVLLTHDAPDYPPGFQPKGDPEFRALSKRSMEMIAELIARHAPGLHVHGHWHHRHWYASGDVTTTVGLASNVNKFNDAVMLWSRPEWSVLR